MALILEDDSAPRSPHILDQVDELLSNAPEDWEFIQLGRCWDLWCDKESEIEPVATFGTSRGNESTFELRDSMGFELCSHAYLVTRKGAEKILQYSIPMMLPYDHTLMLMGREGILS